MNRLRGHDSACSEPLFWQNIIPRSRLASRALAMLVHSSAGSTTETTHLRVAIVVMPSNGVSTEARRRAIVAALGFAASLWLCGQSSAEPDELEQLYRQCGEAEIAGLIAECLIAKERDLGKQLDQVYRQALISVERNAALLRESQRNWLKYQESNCRYHEKRSSEEGPGVARLSYARCLLRSTLQRLEELKEVR